MSEKRGFHHGDLKNEIIKQGLKIIAKKGFKAVELKDIAKACGVSTPSIYRHFNNKDSLMESLLFNVAEIFYDFLATGVNSDFSGDPKENLVYMGLRFVKFSQEYPRYFEFLFYSGFERHLNLGADIQLKHCHEKNSFELFKQEVIKYLNGCGVKNNYNLHIVNLWAYISGLAGIVDSLDVADKDKILAEYISSMVQTYTLGITHTDNRGDSI